MRPVHIGSLQDRVWSIRRDHLREQPDAPQPIHWMEAERWKAAEGASPYTILKCQARRLAFHKAVTTMIGETVHLSATIDKKGHSVRYGENAWHPYHYLLSIIMERVSMELCSIPRVSMRVEVESRGHLEDELLEAEYRRVSFWGPITSRRSECSPSSPKRLSSFSGRTTISPACS